jgi:hypothetical protein
MWTYDDRSGLAAVLALMLGWGGGACATPASEADDPRLERPQDCVITEMGWAGLTIQQCYGESAPDDLPKDARIPFIATSTRTPIGTFSNPVTVRFGTEEGEGFVVTFSEPVPPGEASPDLLDEIDAIRRQMEAAEEAPSEPDETSDGEGDEPSEDRTGEQAGDDSESAETFPSGSEDDDRE